MHITILKQDVFIIHGYKTGVDVLQLLNYAKCYILNCLFIYVHRLNATVTGITLSATLHSNINFKQK